MKEFKNGQEITTKKDARFLGVESKGRIIGWVGYPKPNLVRVQWDNGDVSDYTPERLEAILPVS